MPLIHLVPKGTGKTCTITEEGRIVLPQYVLDQLDWQYGSKIAVSYILEPLTLLLRRDDGALGFTLTYANRTANGKGGGKITCSRFANEVLRTRMAFPLRGIKPIILEGNDYQLALMIQTPEWEQVEFSQTGCQSIPTRVQGVYELLSSDGMVLRVGEGSISSRIKHHLKNEQLAQNVKTVRYFTLVDKDESGILEQILLGKHKAEYGKLPQFNLIRA
jgi:bifunctional DNA-binding transcriptional regulator/antitoxin component of YhaV-PrlF toxin-antitoxin module